MELRELAEQVLFAPNLALKLACPTRLTDERPGRGVAAPAEPVRPTGLEFCRGRSPTAFPSLRRLEQEAVRGQLLHFFANHELLATELMALVLLKFPDAPKSFRRGVLKTLRDEQEHTRIYLERLRQLGVEFGQYPVNGFFWRVIAPMETPLSYVSRLSLTFEQANLDYSGYFAGQFQQIGDQVTEQIFHRIHRDEIGHVGYGLKWFRRWKDPALTDWEAFQKELEFPLSPSRAKAEPFDPEARRKAGLDDEFINQLYVYAKSKGRTPAVHWFNPLAESALGRPPSRRGSGPGFRARSHLVAMARDLANLPQFLGGPDDVVLVPRAPRTEFLAELKNAGFDPPQFEVLEDGGLAAGSELRGRKIGWLRPWAWTPDSIALLQPLRANLTSAGMPVGADWERHIKPLFAKSWAAQRLREFLAGQRDADWLCPPAAVGIVVRDDEEAWGAIRDIRRQGYQRLVAKTLCGSAGNNLLRLWEPDLLPAQQKWLQRLLELEGALIIEPWLDRVLDFSVQWDMGPHGLRQIGWVKMRNDLRGQFQASVWTPRFTHGCSRELAAFVHGGSGDRTKELFARLADFLEPRLARAGFQGALGLDAFIYRDATGGLRLKPMVEINARYTMGRLLVELMKHAAPGRSGVLELIGRPQLRRQGCASLGEYARQLKSQCPLHFAGGPKPRIVSGAVCLNDPKLAEVCLAVLRIGKDAAAQCVVE